MSHPSRSFGLLFAATLLATAAAIPPRAQEYTATRNGVIDGIHTVKGVTTLDVTLTGELAQPENPALTTGTPDPSRVTSFTNGTTKVAPGMPVYLVIIRSGATFTPVIGHVEAVVDATHCLVRVDPEALGQTWQDPSDGNNTHRVGEYLSEGAAVSVGGLTGQ